MKFNLKTVLVIDAIILVCGISTFLFGQQIGDFLHPSPNKAFYKEINTDLDKVFNDLDNGQLSDAGELNKAFDGINQKTIKASKNLFQKELTGNEDSIANLDAILGNLNKNHIYSGDRSILSIYIGNLIISKTPAEWSYDKDYGSYFLKSTKNEESVDPYDYIENRIIDEGTNFDDYYKESIKKLGGAE